MIVVCSGILVKVANRHEDEIVAQQQQVQLSEEERKKIKRERKALWNAIYVNATFLVCYVPGIVVCLITATIIPSEDQNTFVLYVVGASTIGFAPTVNPIVLCRRNAHIGKEIRKLAARIGYHGGTVLTRTRAAVAGRDLTDLTLPARELPAIDQPQ